MKRYAILMVLMLTVLTIWAQAITEQQARERVQQFLSGHVHAGTRMAVGRQLETAGIEAPRLYAFNIEGGGYVVASGDSRVLPVLGYSGQGRIDWATMPTNMQAWLKGYSKTIAALGSRTEFVDGHSSRGKAVTRSERQVIEPLIKTAWSQYAPYSMLTPVYDGANDSIRGMGSLTGCVATAMAQIMNYYQWPQAACPAIPGYDIETKHGDKEKVWHVDGLPSVTFDWEHMLSCYWPKKKLIGTYEEKMAVATLMRYCGQAVKMNYSPKASAANHQEAAEAYIRYFGYDPGLKSVSRAYYRIDEWENLVYEELAAGRPLQYAGYNLEEGHSFICDGYNSDGFFHMNWGWDGYLDGYFSLSVLNQYEHDTPEESTIGVGFNIEEEMIIGVKPAPEGTVVPERILPYICLSQDVPIEIHQPDTAAFIFYFNTESYGLEEVRADYAFGTCDDNGLLTPSYIGDPADSIVYAKSSNIFLVEINSTSFSPGEHRILYPMVKLRSIPGCDWQMLGSKEFCIHTGLTDAGQYYLYYQKPELEVVSAEITRGLAYEGGTCDIAFTIKNRSSYETTLPLMVIPHYYGDISQEALTADSPCEDEKANICGIYLHGGEEATLTCDFELLHCGLVKFEVLSCDKVHIGDVFMTIGKSTAISDPRVSDAKETRQAGGGYADLTGRRLNGQPWRKGVYIQNGRLVIIK